ncbi:MAG: TolC family protein [Sulfurimonas sp.]
MKLFKIILGFALISTVSATEIYNIDDLTIKAVENSPDLRISSANYEASKSRYKQANANYLPKVDLHVSAGEVGTSNIPTNPDNMINDTLLLGKLSINQIIYDFGKTSGNSDSLKYDSQSFSNEYKQNISDKKRDVKSAYYDVLKAIALINVNKENVKLNKAQLYRSQKYFNAGIRTKIDISDASVELIKSNLDLKKSQYDLKLAYAELDKVVGFEAIENNYRVYSKDLDLTNLYQTIQQYNLSLEDSVNFSYKNRYEIKKQMSQIKVAKANNYLASSQYYPSIYLNADYTKQEVDKLKSSLPKDQWQASLNLDWNIYQGGATDASTQEKKIKIDIANSNLAYSKLIIKTKTTQAYINVHKARDSVELSQSILQVSSEKFNQASKRYEHGLSDFIELQQSRQGYIDAMASLVVDYYNYYNSIAILDNAIGK